MAAALLRKGTRRVGDGTANRRCDYSSRAAYRHAGHKAPARCCLVVRRRSSSSGARDAARLETVHSLRTGFAHRADTLPLRKGAAENSGFARLRLRGLKRGKEYLFSVVSRPDQPETELHGYRLGYRCAKRCFRRYRGCYSALLPAPQDAALAVNQSSVNRHFGCAPPCVPVWRVPTSRVKAPLACALLNHNI